MRLNCIWNKYRFNCYTIDATAVLVYLYTLFTEYFPAEDSPPFLNNSRHPRRQYCRVDSYCATEPWYFRNRVTRIYLQRVQHAHHETKPCFMVYCAFFTYSIKICTTERVLLCFLLHGRLPTIRSKKLVEHGRNTNS